MTKETIKGTSTDKVTSDSRGRTAFAAITSNSSLFRSDTITIKTDEKSKIKYATHHFGNVVVNKHG